LNNIPQHIPEFVVNADKEEQEINQDEVPESPDRN